MVDRSKIAREKSNIPFESTQIPNYRQLLMTKKFNNFTRCTCDHDKDTDKSDEVSKCGRHKNTHKKTSIDSSGASDSSLSSSGSDSDSSISSSDYNTSSGSGSDASTGSKSSKGSQDKEKKKGREKPEEFEDIKSMEIHRKQNHPERLHKDLMFNEPDQVC